ncbi:MAG TPA: RHS repeat-associated core domain-containing protein [Tepidisphaeraceae bacterium]|nr:RHS repeat-associated core domain-containing protein [Tepidisphaeraceae bacterium]
MTSHELNNIVHPTPLPTRYGYDAAGRRDLVILPNGVTTDYDFDAVNRLELVTIEKSDGTLLSSYDYVVRADGQRDAATESVRQDDGSYRNVSIDWVYDNLNRLMREVYDVIGTTAGDFAADYSLDLVGNRLEKKNDTGNDGSADQIITYLYNANDQLTDEAATKTVNGVTSAKYGVDFTYDANGSLVAKARTGEGAESSSFTYDLRNKMITATIGGVAATYKYDDSGIRVSVTENGQTTYYVIDANNPTGYQQVIEEKQGSPTATPSKSYVIGDDVIAQAVEAVLNYLAADGHGSTRQLLDAAGAILQRYHYDAFGNALGFEPHAALTTLLYAGEQFDRLLKWSYNRARYYDANSGTFPTFDAYEGRTRSPSTLHKYGYGHGNPINNSDPTGHWSKAEVLVVVGIAAILVNIGLTVYNGVRKGASANAIAWQVTQNLATFAVIYGAVALTGPIAIVSWWALAGAGVKGAYDLYVEWPKMDATDKAIVVALLATYGAFGISVRPTPQSPRWGEASVLPESYFANKVAIDMRNAPANSPKNAAGFPRNGPWFWEQLLEMKPEWFSATNRNRINGIGQRKTSPRVDETWSKYHPEHAAFDQARLVHHHIGQGAYAAPIPEPVHQSYHGTLHPD